jgi:plasmid segregation protein ParM
MSIHLKLTGGADIGNGYVKMVARGHNKAGAEVIDEIDIPSGVAIVNRPLHLPTPDDQAASVMSKTGEDSIFNNLDVSFVSPMITDQYRRLFGARGISADGAFEEFDVVGHRSKAEQPLSKALVMGLFAAKGLRDYVRSTGSLPAADEVLSIEARVALALPITEYMHHRVGYAAEFMNGTHTVTIHNFATPVTVKLRFVDVQVIAEGASAQYAITAKGEPLMKVMLADVRKRGIALEGIEASDVLAAQHTIGIDVGEGTVNLVVFSNGKFNPDASTTFNKGYGSVLNRAISAMDASGYHSGFSSRKQLGSYLQTQPSAMKRSQYAKVESFVHSEIEFFADNVAEQFGRLLAVVGPLTEVAYVYGGGSGPIKEALYPKLLAKVAEMSGDDESAFPVLYLDASYSRHLNREGLYIAAEAIESRSKKK